MPRIALIGATGLVGGEIAKRVTPADLLLLSRRPSDLAAREIVAPIDDWRDALTGEQIDVAISALGTTIRKAGSKPAFDRVDRLAVVDFARSARDAGARQMIVVSAVGADASASNFYLETKGRMEAELAALGFDRLDILRPGLLRGERTEQRLGESIALRIAPLIDPLLRGRFSHYGSIAASEVAAAAAALARQDQPGRFLHHNREMRALAKL